MKTLTNRLFFATIALLLISGAPETEKLSYASIVNRLIDLEALAVLPEEGEGSAMWSSYDRKSSRSPEGEFQNWAANDDGLTPQYIRKEGENEVLAEMEGPGAIVRIWSASPRQGKVKIYIDGAEVPVLDLPFREYFNPSVPAFEFPELVYETNARGFNNYVPITYQKSCKIVAEPGWGQYYHFNYISFPEGTEVEAFDPDLTPDAKAALTDVNIFFAEMLGNNPEGSGEQIKQISTKVRPGKEETVLDLKNSGAISSIKARVKVKDSAQLEEVLRKLSLKIKWDGEEEAAVWSPLGDFFGTSPGWNEYRTLPMGMTEEWMYSYWYMPFAEGAEVIVRNDFGEEVEVEMQIGHGDLKGDVEQYGRFHAKWHRDLAPLEKERWPDWTLLETEGRGRFVGTHLLVWNPKGGSCSLAQPGQHWWGEGDEKFFIDGEHFPSTFGTGTEDYFGYAWCDPSVFEHAYHSQTQDNDNMGYQPMNRWHIIDNIPFQESFQGYMEKYFPNHWPTQYSVVVYWYLSPDGKDPLGPVPVEERYGYETPFKVYREEGVLEGESLKIDSNSGGWASPDVWAHESMYDEVSGHKIMIWYADPNKDNVLELGFEWPESGTYNLEAHILKTKDGGKFSLQLNGGEVLEIDFSTSGDPSTETLNLGQVDLTRGVQELKLQWLGEKEDGKRMAIDYIKLEKVD